MSYSIDETKLMMKLERYKRRWKEQRHYSEYLKCKLAKKALQNQELKEENAQLTEWLLDLQNGEKDAEIVKLNSMIDRTVNAWESRCIEKYDEIERLNATIDELIKQGNKGNMPYELWKREWNEIVARIQKERE